MHRHMGNFGRPVSIHPVLSQVELDGSTDSAEPREGFAMAKGDQAHCHMDRFSISLAENPEEWLRDGRIGWV